MDIITDTAIRENPIRIPASIPPANSLTIEVPVINPYMIMGILGGIITPMEPPAACTAAANSLL